MPEKKAIKTKKPSAASAKQEMLGAYQEVIGEMGAAREAEMKPEDKIAEKGARAAVAAADGLTTERVSQDLSALKTELVKTLALIGEKLDAEVSRYAEIKRAVEVKEEELAEIYEIQKSASTLAALLEVHQQKRDEFEAEMATRKTELTAEIERLRAEWQDEKAAHDFEIKEQQAAEKKSRDREREDYEYRFKREQQLAREKFDDEKARIERDLQSKRTQVEAALAERERALAAGESELADLRKLAASAPKDKEDAVARAVKEAVTRAQQEAKNREDLMRKEFDGERNVLLARIESLEKLSKDQSGQVLKLSGQIEKAYGQVQDIAVKTVEGAARAKVAAQAEQLAAEQARKGQEK
jgi:hypothetical protein